MRQPWKLLMAMILLAGCRGTNNTADPFVLYGPRRVPPPATGSLGATAPYYQPAAASPQSATPGPAASGQPVMPAPAAAQSPPANLQLPPVGLPPRASGSAPSKSATGSSTSTKGSSAVSAAGWEAPAPTPGKSAEASSSRAQPPSRRLRQATNLRWGGSPSSVTDPNVRRASATSPAPEIAASPSPNPFEGPPRDNPIRPAAAQVTPPPAFVPQGRLLEITQLPPVETRNGTPWQTRRPAPGTAR